MQTVLNCLSSRRYSDALRVLAGISNRNSRWYYYSAFAHAGLGSNVTALDHAKRAVDMEPTNASYRQLYSRLQSGGEWYGTRQTYYGSPVRMNDDCSRISRMCSFLCFAQMCCGGSVPIVCCM